MMKNRIFILAIALVAVINGFAQSVLDHETNIKNQEQIIAERQDSITNLDEQIKDLKTRVDSLNREEKKLREQISALEKTKKGHQTEIKKAQKTRQTHYENRDNLVFSLSIAAVLMAPYNKMDVEEAVQHFDGMETKEVLARKKLVENYGSYTKNLREFLEKQKIILSENGWEKLSPKSELHKKFMKGLKSTSYWKIYDASTKKPSIPYLDNVMEQLMQQAANGLTNSHRFDEIVNSLYSNDY